jgi:hypothetical protein
MLQTLPLLSTSTAISTVQITIIFS